MRPELLIPLECLPGPVPVGAPVSAVRGIHGERRTGVATECHPRNGLRVAWPDGPVFYLSSEDAGALDLSRPSVDADGYPTRIDGADVAAGMLARAMGLDPSGGAVCRVGFSGLRLEAGGRAVEFWPTSDIPACGIPGLTLMSVPALADIDPTDPDADRLALVTVFYAKPWRK